MQEKLLLQVIRTEKKSHLCKIPLWFMRQAGRYLPEYRKQKLDSGSFLEMCTNPEVATEISLQPLKRFDLDAVIFFCDILTPLIPMGIDLKFIPEPIIQNPIENKRDIEKLKPLNAEKNLDYVRETLKMIALKMPLDKTLIGFGGAPFTLAAYLCRKKKNDFSDIKRFCFRERKNYLFLMKKLEESCFEYLKYQIQSKAEVIQIFDSWAGCFHLEDYKKLVLPFVQRLIENLKKISSTPVIYYLNGGSHLVDALLETGSDVLSLDWKTDIREVLSKIKNKKITLQGNLDPFYLFSKKEVLQEEVKKIIHSFGEENWIFNVGQGLDRETPIENLELVIRQIRKARP